MYESLAVSHLAPATRRRGSGRQSRAPLGETDGLCHLSVPILGFGDPVAHLALRVCSVPGFVRPGVRVRGPNELRMPSASRTRWLGRWGLHGARGELTDNRTLLGRRAEMIRGECLCGRVRFELSGYREGVHICHCSVCRKITGAAHSATLIADHQGFRWISGRDCSPARPTACAPSALTPSWRTQREASSVSPSTSSSRSSALAAKSDRQHHSVVEIRRIGPRGTPSRARAQRRSIENRVDVPR